MKYVIGAITFVIGLLANFLTFTQAGTKFMINNYGKVFGLINDNVILILSIISIPVAIYNLVKNKERILSILALVANIIFVVYFVFLFKIF